AVDGSLLVVQTPGSPRSRSWRPRWGFRSRTCFSREHKNEIDATAMRPEDYARVENRDFDREYWASLWDRIPTWARRGTVIFVLHKLHAIETNGAFSISWDHEVQGGTSPDIGDRPGDVISFTGQVRIGQDEEDETESDES